MRKLIGMLSMTTCPLTSGPCPGGCDPEGREECIDRQEYYRSQEEGFEEVLDADAWLDWHGFISQ